MGKSPNIEPRSWGEKRSVFLGLREAIRLELDTGRSLRSAYVASGADKAMGYSIFTRYVARYLPAESEIQRWGSKRTNETAPLTSQVRPPATAPAPAAAPAYPTTSLSGTQKPTETTPKENNDGPKAPPRPRGFIRRPGLPDDNKDQLI
jgi:hypothetical protein